MSLWNKFFCNGFPPSRCPVYQQEMHYCYLWRAREGGLQVSCRFLFWRTVCQEAYDKMNTPHFCGFWYRTKIPRAAVFCKNKTKNKIKAPLNYLDYSQHFLEIWLQNTILELIQKCLGVWSCFVADRFFQFCYELLLKWQRKLYVSIWLFMTKDWLEVGLETCD